MQAWGFINKYLIGTIYRFAYYLDRVYRRIKGLPKGLTFKTLNQLCLAHLGQGLKSVFYKHASAWKSSGAYFLFLNIAQNQHWRLIYKRAVYCPKTTPALLGLSIRPGPAEYVVYKNNHKQLGQYLPKVYLAEEDIPGKQYRYILEDLSKEYQQAKESDHALLQAASELPTLHHALAQWSKNIDLNLLPKFDETYVKALLHYAKSGIEHYAQKTSDKDAKAIYKRWPDILTLHQKFSFWYLDHLTPIHGDYNASNIYIHKTHPNRIKVVDWEWAGIGLPHADLAALLKRVTPDIETQALKRFSQHYNELSPAENKDLYEWCQLLRGILDASFLARQHLYAPYKVGWLSKDITASFNRVFVAYNHLSFNRQVYVK